MLTAFLAGSGGRVVIPDAVDVVDGATQDEVRFVDGAGRTLCIFRRHDLTLYSADGPGLDALNDGAEGFASAPSTSATTAAFSRGDSQKGPHCPKACVATSRRSGSPGSPWGSPNPEIATATCFLPPPESMQ